MHALYSNNDEPLTPKVPPELLSGEIVREHTRNVALTRIAGTLHDGSRDLAQLTVDLQAINRARCKPPLPKSEVAGIAKSIHRYDPCSSAIAPGKEREEVEAAQDTLISEIDSLARQSYWRGRAALTDKSIL